MPLVRVITATRSSPIPSPTRPGRADRPRRPPTTGHHPADPHPPRRLDRILCTPPLAADVLGHHVHQGADDISDHRPVVLDLASIPGPAEHSTGPGI